MALEIIKKTSIKKLFKVFYCHDKIMIYYFHYFILLFIIFLMIYYLRIKRDVEFSFN